MGRRERLGVRKRGKVEKIKERITEGRRQGRKIRRKDCGWLVTLGNGCTKQFPSL